jgi:CBS domain-containing protein
MATTIADIMTARVVTVRSGEPVAAAVERMTRFGFSALPVVTASSRLVGVVSLLDVLRRRQEDAEWGTTTDERTVPVDEIMTTDVLTMSPTANAAAVADRQRRHGELRVLPICTGGRLVGVVTRGDLLRRLLPGAPTRRRGLFGLRRADDAADALALLAAPRRPRPPANPEAPVRDVMTTDVVTARPDDLVEEAAVAMLRDRHSALPVVDGTGLLLGVVSEADLLADATVRRPGRVTVGRVMTTPAAAVPVDTTVAQARALLVEHGLRTLPVVTGDDRLVGVLGRSDLV